MGLIWVCGGQNCREEVRLIVVVLVDCCVWYGGFAVRKGARDCDGCCGGDWWLIGVGFGGE